MKNLNDYNNEFNNLYNEINKSIKNLSIIDSYVDSVNQYLTKTKEINDGLKNLFDLNKDFNQKTFNSLSQIKKEIEDGLRNLINFNKDFNNQTFYTLSRLEKEIQKTSDKINQQIILLQKTSYTIVAVNLLVLILLIFMITGLN